VLIAVMAKTTPGQFVRQVRQEMSKVTWPGRREAGLSMVMVFAFCAFIGLFFMVVDKILSLGVSWLFG
tara:strand:- start:717 stop:920 length:204 start_codon:yes stop_codon:yes gene_type:complete